MLCSLVDRSAQGSVTPRQAIIGGTFWCGVGLMSLLALYLRLFSPAGRERFRRRFLTALMLAAVTGLDIIPSAILAWFYFTGKMHIMLPSVEWWNEHVDWFVYTALWAPHALASMLACFTGFLLLWNVPATRPWRHRLAAGAALASAAGSSIYVAFVSRHFPGGVDARDAAQEVVPGSVRLAGGGWGRDGAGGAVRARVRRGAGGPVAGGMPLGFTVREFALTPLIAWWAHLGGVKRLLLVNGPLIPLNYLLELGVFFAGGLFWWRQRRGRALSRQELASAVMIATSILICTFLRSSVIGCNDLGWRGFLIAQFMLLLVTADLFCERDVLRAKDRAILVIFLALGAVGTVYDLAITRTYPVLADAGVFPPLDWMSPDRHSGQRTYASRAAYEWVRRATPKPPRCNSIRTWFFRKRRRCYTLRAARWRRI